MSKTKIASRTDLIYSGAFAASIVALLTGTTVASIVVGAFRPPFPADAHTIDTYNLMLTTVGTAVAAIVIGAGFVPLTWIYERWGVKVKSSTAMRGAVLAAGISAAYFLVTINSAMYTQYAWNPSVWADFFSVLLVGLFYPAAWFLTTRR